MYFFTINKRVFSKEIEFPYESQITIALNQDGIIGFNDQVIGQTTIDLENRYYSKCYATCGIPKSYNETGFNAWRDSKQPSEILNYLCREHHMSLPLYDLTKMELFVKNYCLTENDKGFTYRIDMSNRDNQNLSMSMIKQKLALLALNDWENITKVIHFFFDIFSC